MKNGRNDVNEFWASFRKSVIKYGISESDSDWYVKWGEKFAVLIKGKSLRQRTGEDIISFISKLRNDKRTQKWQIEQVKEALSILYNNYLKVAMLLPESNKNDKYKKVSESSDLGETIKDNLARKEEILQSHGNLIEKIKNDILKYPITIRYFFYMRFHLIRRFEHRVRRI